MQGSDTGVGRNQVGLKRSLGLAMLVLYGLGVTIGAGIYVLIGAAAARAGIYAPLAFVLAAMVMAPSAATFAELGARMPSSAGEAVYVRAGFRSEILALITGLMVLAVSVTSAAAVSRGTAGYIHVLVPLPQVWIVAGVVIAMGAVAAWGIVESVAIAGVMTMIEVAGLVAVITVGWAHDPGVFARLPAAWPGLGNAAAWSGVLAASLMAVFAFIGFEGMANVAEEVREPQRTLPRAILITLLVTMALYVAVVWVAVNAVPVAELGRSEAPLSLVFSRVTGASPLVITLVAIVATINGVIVFLVMASRVVHGMAAQGLIPAALARVNPVTRTPLLATGLVTLVSLVLATTLPIDWLAETTSRITLAIFALVNASLVLLKRRHEAPPEGSYEAPTVMPYLGAITSAGLLAATFLPF